MALVLEKKDIHKFLEHLCFKYTVVAPIKRESDTTFDIYQKDSTLDLGYETTNTSVKRYFFKPQETLIKYKKGKAEVHAEDDKLLVFGLQMADAAALKILDEAFEKPIPDTPYLERRKKATIVAFENTPTPNSFYDELELDCEGVADAVFTDAGDKYVVEAKTPKGEKLVKNRYIKGKDVKNAASEKFKGKKINLKKVMNFLDKGPNHSLWIELAEECFACGACAYACPICHCFDVTDRLNITGTEGDRSRCWDSCMLADFSAVAMGGNFRPERHERIHNWYHHKFSRAVKERGKPDCVGCGRCITVCPAKIKIHDIIKKCEEMG
ncbi:MAG: 4Fe-4S dicluster domain-containing protein [Candidatus Altiarchaeota archaeon]|nr:4Fe-4S dicluster domain-containing protein [Candidatus Altiarchaeota archaeon]